MTTVFWLKVLEQGLIFAVMAMGVHLTYRVLDFPDLSVDGSFALGAAVVAAAIIAGVNPALATLLAVVAGTVAGVCTGFLHVRLGVTNLLSGILVMTALYSINLRLMGRANLALFNFPTIFADGIPPLTVLAVIALAVKFILDTFLATRAGLLLRATGDNPHMLASLGVTTGSTKLLGLAVSNGLVALSGAVMAQYQGFADVGMGQGTMVMGLGAVILGGALFSRVGLLRGTTMTLVGTVAYRMCLALAVHLGLAPTDLKLITAALVIGAIALAKVKKSKKKGGAVSAGNFQSA